jgi:CRISPR-associated endonuclease Csn1
MIIPKDSQELNMGITLGFDVGKASLGICARTDERILALETYIIPVDYAATEDLRKRRRMFRTRMAHQQRECWFMQAIWLKAGLPDYANPIDRTAWEALKSSALSRYGNDKRLWTREFPAKGDHTVFNSALLRIMLIEGKPLEDWQIWKALWSAIQKRGAYYYDWKSVPPDLESVEGNAAALLAEKEKLEEAVSHWSAVKKAAKAEEKKEADDQWKLAKEALTNWKAIYQTELDQIGSYQERIREIAPTNQYHLPCYLEASRLGLWAYDDANQTGKVVSTRIDCQAESIFRGTIKKRLIPEDPTSESDVTINEGNVPRAFRIKELRQLWTQAKQQLIVLQAYTFEYFMYGDSQAPFATVGYKTELAPYKKRRGMGPNYLMQRQWQTGKLKIKPPEPTQAIDTQGVHGQKVPRFDNRIIAKCQLFKTRNVCKASTEENKQYSLLIQLKNLRFISHKESRGLTAPELKAVFEAVKTDLFEDKKTNELAKRRLHEVLKANVHDYVSLLHCDAKEKIKLNLEGRARFSRPALKLMNYILLNGLSPSEDVDAQAWAEACEVKLSNDPKKGVTYEEISNALGRLGNSWQYFHPGDDRDGIFNLAQQLHNDQTQKRQAVMQLIGTCNNPVVRHRLTFFYNQLVKLEVFLAKKGYDIAQEGKVNIEFVRGADSGFDGKKKAKDFEDAIKKGEAQNDRIRQDLLKSGAVAKRVTLIKLKLLEEQGGICPYSV